MSLLLYDLKACNQCRLNKVVPNIHIHHCKLFLHTCILAYLARWRRQLRRPLLREACCTRRAAKQLTDHHWACCNLPKRHLLQVCRLSSLLQAAAHI